MFRLAVEFVKPGMVLGRDVYNSDGRIILSAGATLSSRYIDVFAKWDIETLYIHRGCYSYDSAHTASSAN